METVDVLPLLDQLDDDIDDVEEVLDSVLPKSLTETSQKLPVLDKAKFHIGIVYALETLIFSYLKLRGIDAIQHPVYKEVTRLKHYFAKIENAEKPPEQRTMTLDKAAAGRFIKHGLAGNDRIDTERKEQNAKEKARAQLKASILAKKAEQSEQSSKQPSEADANSGSGPDDESSDNEEMTGVKSTPATEQSKTAGLELVPKKSSKHTHHMKSKKPKHLRKKELKRVQREEKRERKEKKQEIRKARQES